MKKIELLYFTVAKNCVSTARQWNTYGILFSVEQMTFFCRAVEIPKKCVEQSRFEQLHFEQLTLTLKKNIKNLKRIRTLKDQNDDNYLWRSTYGYQGLWGVRLGWVRLGYITLS
jgi:hypothetical protein